MATTINSTGQVSVGTSSTVIIAAVTGGKTRQSVTVYNTSAATVYVGGAGVTTSTGHGVAAGQSLTLSVTGAIYGIVVSSTATVSYIEVV